MEKVDILTALLIIESRQDLSNSYDLCKVLAWKFGIINCQDIITSLTDAEMIHGEYVNGVGRFNILAKGSIELNAKKQVLIQQLKREHPLHIAFIDSLAS